MLQLFGNFIQQASIHLPGWFRMVKTGCAQYSGYCKKRQLLD
jgi:hypothetical protein